MKFTVIWKPLAEAALAQIWTAAADRNAVAAAANTIDRLLQRDPLSQGESRVGSIRIMYESPLGVYFQVRELDRLVNVLRVFRYR